MIVCFPTYARRLPGQRRWRATVAGMVSRPLPPRSHRRTLAIGVIKRLLELDDAQIQSDVFQRRADAFLFQRVAGARVRIVLGDRLIDAGLSDRVGHFLHSTDFDEDEIASIAAPDAAPGGQGRWLTYEALLQDDETLGGTADGGRPPAVGRVQCVEDEGLSVISDIDDTIKVSNVAHKRELLANTLVREFAAVPGMPELYRRWEATGTAFHYVSASPWQLATCLTGFLREAGLPCGSMHLKLFRLKDSTPLGRLPSRKRSKRRTIEQIMGDFPSRRFLLVGDSGERDPEVYTAVARRHPHRVAGVAIRQVEGRPSREKIRSRLDRLARRLPGRGLHVFTEATELDAILPRD